MSAGAGAAATIRAADVRAANGVRWIVDGFHIYRARPLIWSGLTLGWLVISFGLLLVPLIGGIVANVLQPVFFASFAFAARRQLAGERVDMGDLFLGFRANRRALVNVGMLELAAAFAIVFGLTFLAGPLDSPLDASATRNAEELAKVLQDKAGYIFAGLALYALVKGALWFAPALIAFHGLSAMHAIRWSVYAALSNIGAMLTYLLALSAMYLVAALPWALGFIVAVPVMCLSTYTGYRDVFERDGSPPPDTGARGQAPRG